MKKHKLRYLFNYWRQVAKEAGVEVTQRGVVFTETLRADKLQIELTTLQKHLLSRPLSVSEERVAKLVSELELSRVYIGQLKEELWKKKR